MKLNSVDTSFLFRQKGEKSVNGEGDLARPLDFRFENDHFAAFTGYGDYVQGNLMICHVYYFEGDDLLTSSREYNLYTISISEFAASSSVCLMSKATSTKSWLWHQRLSHLNFGTINQLTSKDLVDGLPKFKYDKDHLCSACEQGKSKKSSFLTKLVPSTESKLELIHMDLCGPMRVESINGKKYILVIVDDYSRYTWFKNEKLRSFYAKLGIVHNTSIARTPQQNGVVERRNRTLVEAARTMLIFSKTTEFLWAKAIATKYYAPRTSEVLNNSTANTLDDEDTLSPSLIIVEDKLDGNTIMHSFKILEIEEAESSSNNQDLSNMHEFHQQHCYTDK
ncbi:retrovirus-related pol polyprotein from transposon TNT 1-94 [Tanacetum coccineum]